MSVTMPARPVVEGTPRGCRGSLLHRRGEQRVGEAQATAVVLEHLGDQRFLEPAARVADGPLDQLVGGCGKRRGGAQHVAARL